MFTPSCIQHHVAKAISSVSLQFGHVFVDCHYHQDAKKVKQKLRKRVHSSAYHKAVEEAKGKGKSKEEALAAGRSAGAQAVAAWLLTL